MNKKRPRADLFKLTAVMNDKGNVEMDMDCVNPEHFIRAMEKGMPSFDGTYKIASLVRYLKSMGDEAIEKSSRYV